MKKYKVDSKEIITIVFCAFFIALGITIICYAGMWYETSSLLVIFSEQALAVIGRTLRNFASFTYIIFIFVGIATILLSVMKLSIAADSINKQKKLSSQKVESVEEFGDEDIIIQKVEKMHGLYEKGVLNEDEYSKIKSNLLNRM